MLPLERVHAIDIEHFKEDLKRIKAMNFVPSMRSNNTGIGFTLESLMGKREDNLRTPDFGDVEIKSQRRNVTNPVTMFTLDRRAWKIRQRQLILKYGYVDDQGRKALYCSVTKVPNNQGMFLKVIDGSLSIVNTDGVILAQWTIESLIQAFEKKMPALVVVYADVQYDTAGREKFWFNEAYFYKEPNVDNFIKLIGDDCLVVDIRMHLKENGGVRNHGTGFRLDEACIPMCFRSKEQLI